MPQRERHRIMAFKTVREGNNQCRAKKEKCLNHNTCHTVCILAWDTQYTVCTTRKLSLFLTTV